MAGALDLLNLIKGQQTAPGLRIAKVSSTEPDKITITFEGEKLALGLEIFEVPVGLYPLKKDDRLLAFPLIGEQAGQRWGIIEKINGGITMATMQSATSLQVDGMDKVYSDDLIIPPYFVVSDTSSVYSDSYTGKTSDDYLKKAAISPLKAGDRVSIAPTWDAKIKYVVLQRY